MISHALTIVMNELESHLADAYQTSSQQVRLGNVAEGLGSGSGNGNPSVPRDVICLSLVNVKEEKALKNLPNYVRNETKQTIAYENQPVFLNCQVLVTATHNSYTNALLMLSRAIRFFQYKNVFTQDNVAPESITQNAPGNSLDQLETFKLILDLYSPNMEEVNHMWGTLGGKQYPFVIYVLRLMELQFKATQSESVTIAEIVSDFRQKAEAN